MKYSANIDLVYAPHNVTTIAKPDCKLFLAGSIEMGKAPDWQAEMMFNLAAADKHQIENFKSHLWKTLLVFNPRRPDFDVTQEQAFENQYFNEQVTWELEHITSSDVVLFNFCANTLSPISLLELGIVLERVSERKYGGPKKVFIVCEDGYDRKGNIQITVAHFKNKTYDDAIQLFDRRDQAYPELVKYWRNK